MPALPNKQDVAVEMFYSGAWNAVTTDAFTQEQITTTWGQGDEGAAPRPGRIALTLNNATDKYRPSNPLSPLYGLAGRNTPVRVKVGGTVQMTAEATSYTPERTIDFKVSPARGRSTVDLEANGLLYRLNQWSTPLRSPFYRYNAALTTSNGYWPLEDERTAQDIFTPTPGAFTQNVGGGFEFGSRAYPAGSDPLATLSLNNYVTMKCAPSSSMTAGWQASFVTKMIAQPVVGTFNGFFTWNSTDGTSLQLVMVDTTLHLYVFRGSGSPSAILDLAVSASGTDWTLFNTFVVKATVVASTVTMELSWITEGSANFATTSGTYAATTTGAIERWGILADEDGATYGHVLFTVGVTEDLELSTRIDAYYGYPGERAGTRFLRICSEEGVSASLLGNASDTWPMGPQRSDTILATLREIVQTDDALIYDDRSSISIIMRTRVNRYSQTAALALSWPNDISPPFVEVLDDLDTHNSVTVSNRSGAEASKELTTGAMSTQAPPNGVGLYKQTVDVNSDAESTALPLLAGWWLSRGTLARSRYRTITIDLVARPGLVSGVNALKPGDLITVASYEPSTIPLIVIGITQKIGSHTRTAVLTTVPAELFVPGVYNTARYDSSSTVTNASYAAGVTTIVFKTTNFGDLWSTTGTPYLCECSGEQFTVTAMSAASGTGPYTQSATVTRAANGIAKTLPANTEIHTATAGRYAL